ncbi:hypothetical protein Tco_0213092 [Tanacetum coccineum]
MKPSIHLGRYRVYSYASQKHSVLADIEDSMDPSDAMTTPSQLPQSQKDFVFKKLTEIHSFLLTFYSDSIFSWNPVKEILLKMNQSDNRLYQMVVD